MEEIIPAIMLLTLVEDIFLFEVEFIIAWVTIYLTPLELERDRDLEFPSLTEWFIIFILRLAIF